MNIADQFLNMYDTCKRSQSPDQCRSMVLAAVPPLMNTYLRSYDVCLRGFSPQSCRKVFAPAKAARVSAVKWFGVGFAVGFFVKRIL